MLAEGAVEAAASHLSERETHCWIAAIVMGGMMTYLHYQKAIRSFQMITQVPDRVSRWFGQGGENLGEGDDTKSSTTMVVGEVRSGVHGITGKGGTVGAMTSAMKDDGGGSGGGDGGKDTAGAATSTGQQSVTATPTAAPTGNRGRDLE